CPPWRRRRAGARGRPHGQPDRRLRKQPDFRGFSHGRAVAIASRRPQARQMPCSARRSRTLGRGEPEHAVPAHPGQEVRMTFRGLAAPALALALAWPGAALAGPPAATPIQDSVARLDAAWPAASGGAPSQQPPVIPGVQPPQPRTRSVTRKILGGVAGGVGGFFLGGYLGAKI